jgi:uncharacterized membrane protein
LRQAFSFFCAGIILLLCTAACSSKPLYPEAGRIGQDISVDVSGLTAEAPKFFSWHHNGRRTNFFVVKTEGGIISFLDACMKCYPKKMGFRFDKDSVVCRACNERYPVSQIEKGFGSCYPIRLEGRQKEAKYLVSITEIERAGQRFFR